MRIQGLFVLLIFLGGGSPGWAQVDLEPCGAFERDGVPGQTNGDFLDAVRYWRQTSDAGDGRVPDYDEDGTVTVLDLARQKSCVQLGPGLLGNYYGYHQTPEAETMSLVSTDHPDFEPVVVKATPRLESIEDFRPLLNSDMTQYFRATFHGFLQVPETAEYTLGLASGEGMRLTLDGTERLFYDGDAVSQETTLTLSAGYYPIRVDYYTTSDRSPRLLFYWRSNGSVIGMNNVTVAEEYLWHHHREIETAANTNLTPRFWPAPFSRVEQHVLPLRVRLYAPETDYRFLLNGTAVDVRDGVVETRLNLTPGLNDIPWELEAGGRRTAGKLTYYNDTGETGQPGLAAMFYSADLAEEHDVDRTHLPVVTTSINTADLSISDEMGIYPWVGGHYIGANMTALVRGRLHIEQAGWYAFSLDSHFPSQFRLNGQVVLWRYGGARGATVWLDAGFHHIELTATRPNNTPSAVLFWDPDDTGARPIPADKLSFTDSDWIDAADFSQNRGANTRVGGDLIAEYLFESEAPYTDQGSFGFDLQGDPRWIVRPTGGITANGPVHQESSVMSSHFLKEMRERRQFTLEFDWHFSPTSQQFQDLFYLPFQTEESRDFYLFARTRQNHFNFQMMGTELEAPVPLEGERRYHIVVTWDGITLALFIDGVIQQSVPFSPDLGPGFPLSSLLHLGDSRRHPFRGTINVLALYSRALNPTEINQNRQANLALRNSTATLPVGEPFEIVPPGTSQAQLEQALHVLNRLSFGPTPESIREILTIGIDAWIQRQLDPESIPTSEITANLEANYRPQASAPGLKAWLKARMVHSPRQLEEVMAWFWENHFSTDLTKTESVLEEYEENRRFRRLAFGRFEDLLLASALNYPMTQYLDSAANLVGSPNENYAREIFELHSFGEDTGYTYDDIVAAARIFTGWTAWDRRFSFNPGHHDFGEKHIQGGIPLPRRGGLNQGLALIQYIAQSPYTARFIAFKLCQLFVADEPPQDLIDAAAQSFLTNDGEIRAVLSTIFQSPHFLTNSVYRQNKVKTPLEFVIAMLRAVGAPQDHMVAYQDTMNLLGMDLFHFLEPTGFSERSDSWVDTNSVFYRWQLVNVFSDNRSDARLPALDWDLLRHKYGFRDTDDVLRFFELMFAGGDADPEIRNLTEVWLTNGTLQNTELDSDPDLLRNRLPQTMNFYLRLPQFNLQ